MMPIADMVGRLAAAGADPAIAAEIIVEAIEHGMRLSASVLGQSKDNLADRREADKLRKRAKRAEDRENKGKLAATPEANDAGNCADVSAIVSTDKADNRCDLSFLSSSEAIQEVGKKKEVVQRARGERLPPDWTPSADDRQFAIDRGIDPDQLLPEFIDYWIGVPGQRGTKLDWPGTWRNRVRMVEKGSRNGKSASQIRAVGAAGCHETGQDAIVTGMGNIAARVRKRIADEERERSLADDRYASGGAYPRLV